MSLNIDPTKIKPYGDTLDEGRMQFSFAHPAPANEQGKEAAKQLLQKMGLSDIEISYYSDLGENFTTKFCSFDIRKNTFCH